MKKLYYMAPFVLVPVLMLTSDHLDNINVISLSTFKIFILLGLISAVMGNLSQTDKKFDYLMTIIMPFSFFISMFIAGFLDKGDTETCFQLDRAFRCAFQELALILYGFMGLISFLLSFKPIRISNLWKAKQF